MRRNQLNNYLVTPESHAGLWLDRFKTTTQGSEENDKRDLVEEVANIGVAPIYRQAFTRWSSSLNQSGCFFREGEVLGRMVVGLGSESVLETHITLNHTYGVPFIPGSALKGVTAAAARLFANAPWRAGETAYQAVFGDTTSSGGITFFDAWYIPGSASGNRPLQSDVITVHHPDYYQGGEIPADWDDPTPVPFLSCTGRYLFALKGPEAWTEPVFDLLEKALLENGVGAKTSSGYGRISLPKPVDAELADAKLQCEIYQQWTPQQCGKLLNDAGNRAIQKAVVHPKAGRVLALCIVKKVDGLADKDQRKGFQKREWYLHLKNIAEGL